MKTLSSLFEKCNDGKRYCFTLDAIKNKPEGYEELSDLIFKLKENMAEDFIYSTIVGYIDLVESEGEASDDVTESYIENCASVYTSDLLDWLASSIRHVAYINDILAEGAITIDDTITRAIEIATREICEGVNNIYNA